MAATRPATASDNSVLPGSPGTLLLGSDAVPALTLEMHGTTGFDVDAAGARGLDAWRDVLAPELEAKLDGASAPELDAECDPTPAPELDAECDPTPAPELDAWRDLPFHLWDGLHGLRRGRGIVERIGGRLLARTRAERLHQRHGYRSFADFCRERLEIEPRTAQLQILLSSTIDACPELEEELIEGRLSPCQIRELRPVLTRLSQHEQSEVRGWILRARDLPVRDLRRAVREFVASIDETDGCARPASVSNPAASPNPAPCESLAETDRAAIAPNPGASSSSTADPDSASSPPTPGVTLSVSAPTPSRIAWDRGVELARKVLGWNAPQHECVRAMLMEAGVTAATTMEADAARDVHDFAVQSNDAARHATGEFVYRVGWSFVCEMRSRVSEATQRHASRVLDQVRKELTDLDRLLADVDSVDPVAGLEELRLYDRPLTVLFARALAAFRDIHGPYVFGYPDLDLFALQELGMSERSVRSALSQVRLFERAPAIEDAFVSSRIGMGKAMLAGRASRLLGRAGAWIERGESVTHRQLEREVRIHERLHDVDRDLAWKHRDPWSADELEIDLWARLAEAGASVDEVVGQLRREGIAPDHSVLDLAGCGGTGHPGGIAEPCGIAGPDGRRFRVDEPDHTDAHLHAAVISAIAEPGGKRFRVDQPDHTESPALIAATPAASDPGGKRFRADIPDALCDVDPCSSAFVDPATDPLRMRRIERLLDILALATCEDALDLGGEVAAAPRLDHHRATPRSQIRIWLPEDVHRDWLAYRDNVRGRFGPVPDWVVLTLLVDHATAAWLAVDPERRPTEWRILERDDYRCQVPGCSSRSRLEVHHIVFRSQQGTNDASNRITLCHWHHHHGIHDGVVRVTGSAPGGLEWQLGRAYPQRFHGDARR